MWLLYNQADKAPTKENIPLIAQYELKLMHDHLRRVCKFNDIVLRFVPVQMVSHVKSVKPDGEKEQKNKKAGADPDKLAA